MTKKIKTVKLRRCSNRRLYSFLTSSYTNISELQDLVLQCEKLVVLYKKKESLSETLLVLTQIIAASKATQELVDFMQKIVHISSSNASYLLRFLTVFVSFIEQNCADYNGEQYLKDLQDEAAVLFQTAKYDTTNCGTLGLFLRALANNFSEQT